MQGQGLRPFADQASSSWRMSVKIAAQPDIEKARQAAALLCRSLGLDSRAQTQVLEGAAELASGLLSCAGGGHIEVRPLWKSGRAGLEVTAENGHSRTPSQGNAGRPEAPGRFDEWEMKTYPAGRFRVVARKWAGTR